MEGEVMGDFNEWSLLFLGDWGPFAIALLALIGLAVIGLSWYDLKDMRPIRRWTLVVLRSLVYLIAVALLLEPALELKNVTKVKNHVAVMLDSSLSQTLKVDEEGTTRADKGANYIRDLLKQRLEMRDAADARVC